jgi:hybrid cluster-associated redox disulfide protein
MNKKDKKQNIKHEDTVTVTKDMNLGELVAKYPEAAEVILDYGLHCVGCFASSFDTIEAGAKVHGLNDEEIEEMVDRINEVINFKE